VTGDSRTVRIARSALDAIVEHARTAMPAECCGLLLGTGTAVAEAAPTPNVSDDPNRFFIEPRAHIAARRAARERGLEVLGFYHSHPHSSPAPSVTDLLEASYPDHLYLIVGFTPTGPRVRMFRYHGMAPDEVADRPGGHQVGGNFVETPFVTAL
jgi:proteasome lid subunit RPN8/RPN11